MDMATEQQINAKLDKLEDIAVQLKELCDLIDAALEGE